MFDKLKEFLKYKTINEEYPYNEEKFNIIIDTKNNVFASIGRDEIDKDYSEHDGYENVINKVGSFEEFENGLKENK